jgi:hypothetical protein
MDELINVEKEKQARQKPPLSVGRIAGEILAGTAAGFVVAVLATYVLLAGSGGDCMGFGRLAFGLFVFPIVYGPGSGVGVYLVGKRGRQTGSFLWTLGCGFAGVLVIMGMGGVIHSDWLYWVPSMPYWAFVLLVLLIPPILATLGFNATRRYREPFKRE